MLRPHQEIRRLKWSDFSEDLITISLSGDKVKSKRNRLVPVPHLIRRSYLKGQTSTQYIYSTDKTFKADYFKTLWGRFKRGF